MAADYPESDIVPRWTFEPLTAEEQAMARAREAVRAIADAANQPNNTEAQSDAIQQLADAIRSTPAAPTYAEGLDGWIQHGIDAVIAGGPWVLGIAVVMVGLWMLARTEAVKTLAASFGPATIEGGGEQIAAVLAAEGRLEARATELDAQVGALSTRLERVENTLTRDADRRAKIYDKIDAVETMVSEVRVTLTRVATWMETLKRP